MGLSPGQQKASGTWKGRRDLGYSGASCFTSLSLRFPHCDVGRTDTCLIGCCEEEIREEQWAVSREPGLPGHTQYQLANIITAIIIGVCYFLWLLGGVVSEYILMCQGNIPVT